MRHQLNDIFQLIVTSPKENCDAAIKRLISFYSNFEFDSGEQTVTNYGLALSPKHSADCLNDYQRTFAFMNGVHRALEELLNRDSEVINVMYAGTGAYAPLIIPALNYFQNERIQVAFIDIHQESIDNVSCIIDHLGLSVNVEEFLVCDATKFKTDKKFDLIISEVMFRALTSEPQVAVARHLSPLLKSDGVFIPEKITITVNYQDNEHHVLSLSKKNTLKNTSLFESVECKVKQDDFSDIILKTKVSIYEDFILDHNRSKITDDLVLGSTIHVKKDSFKMLFKINNSPNWKINYNP